MKFNIRANKLELTNSIKDYVESKIAYNIQWLQMIAISLIRLVFNKGDA